MNPFFVVIRVDGGWNWRIRPKMVRMIVMNVTANKMKLMIQMNNFQRSLDRYLTSEPPDDSWWFEFCADQIKTADEKFDRYADRVDQWMERLYEKYFHRYDDQWRETAKHCAEIISRLLKFLK